LPELAPVGVATVTRQRATYDRDVADVERNKDVVRSHFDVLNTGAYARLDDLHDPEGRNHAPAAFDLTTWPSGGKRFGPADVRATFEWLRAGFPDLWVEILDLIAEDDRVMARIRMQGTQTGGFGKMPATGRASDAEHIHVFRLDSGKIVEHWAVRDDLKAMLQLGVVAPPALP
jgi:predicted ester cyclase